MIEAEKEKSDHQSMLRWLIAGANDNRKSRAEASERMQTLEEKESAQQKTAKSEQIEGKLTQCLQEQNATNENINWN